MNLPPPQHPDDLPALLSSLLLLLPSLAPNSRDTRAHVLDDLHIDYAQLALPRVASLTNTLCALCPLPLSFDLIELQAALDASLPPDTRAWITRTRPTMACYEVSADEDTSKNRTTQTPTPPLSTPQSTQTLRFRLRDICTNQTIITQHIKHLPDIIWRSRVAIAWRAPLAGSPPDPTHDPNVMIIGYVLEPDAAQAALSSPPNDLPSWSTLLRTLLDPLKLGTRTKLQHIPIPTSPNLDLIQHIASSTLSGAWGDTRADIARARSLDDPHGARVLQRALNLRHRLTPQFLRWPPHRLLSPTSPSLQTLAPSPLILDALHLRTNGDLPLLDGWTDADALLLLDPALPLLNTSPSPTLLDASRSPNPHLQAALDRWLTERRWLATWGFPWHAASPAALSDSSPHLPYPTLLDALPLFDPAALSSPLSPPDNPSRDDRSLASLLPYKTLQDLPPALNTLLSIRGMGPARVATLERWILSALLSWRSTRALSLRRAHDAQRRQASATEDAKDALSEIESLLSLMQPPSPLPKAPQ